MSAVGAYLAAAGLSKYSENFRVGTRFAALQLVPPASTKKTVRRR